MKKLILNSLILLFLISACSKKEDSTTPPPQPDPIEVTDISNQYSVRTLTPSFNGSGGATIDSAGWIYVADFGDRLDNANGIQVTKVDPSSGELTVFATGLVGPSGNKFDSKGNLFQANIKGNTISKISPDGQVSDFVSSGLASPVGIAIDKEDNLYVCNCGGSSISKVTPDGTVSSFVQSSELKCPNGITIDDEGNLYPVNFSNGKVFKVSPDGSLSVLTTLPGNSNAHIDYWNKKLYVVGRSAGQVFEVDMQGKINLLAGSGTIGDTDGDGNEAQFYIPNGIALSKDGQKIYVVDRLLGVGTQLNPVVVRVIEKK